MSNKEESINALSFIPGMRKSHENGYRISHEITEITADASHAQKLEIIQLYNHPSIVAHLKMPPSTPEELTDALLLTNMQIFVATKDNKIVGTISIQDMGERQARVGRLAVDPKHRLKGIGRSLIDHAIKEAFAPDGKYDRLRLGVFMQPEPEIGRGAHALYTRAGFKDTQLLTIQRDLTNSGHGIIEHCPVIMMHLEKPQQVN